MPLMIYSQMVLSMTEIGETTSPCQMIWDKIHPPLSHWLTINGPFGERKHHRTSNDMFWDSFQLSYIEIAFLASPGVCVCVCVCVCVYSACGQTCYVVSMLKYAYWNWSFKYKIQFFWPWQFEWCTLQNFKSKPWINNTIINNYHWFIDPKFCMKFIGIFQRWPTKVNPRMH